MSDVDTTGWGRLARLMVRTSRRRLAAWPVVMGLLVWATATSVVSVYGDAQSRAVYQATAGESAATRVFNGRGYGLDAIGGITAYELGFYTVLVFPVIALHLAIHLTRTQEAAGRVDLLTASRLGRTAPLVAAMVVLTGASAAAALLSAVGLLASGLGTGSIWYAAGLFLLLLSMAAVGLVVAQVATDGQGAHGVGLLVIGVLFLVRGVVDGLDAGPTWLSPLGWFAEIRPFSDPQVWPLPAYVGLTAGLVALAALVNVRRDLGSGLIEPRPGSATAPAWLGTPAGLSARLLRGVWLGWTLGTALWAAVLGVLSREMRDLIEANPEMGAALGAQGADPEDLMVSVGAFFIALLSLGFAAHAITRLGAEEAGGRLGVVLAQPVSRSAWWLGVASTVLSAAGLTLLVSGLALGVGLWIGTGETTSVSTGLWLGSVFMTALLLLAAVCLFLAAVSPRLAGAAWAVFALVMTLDFLGVTLDLPEWTLELSPFNRVGRPPLEPVETTNVVVMGFLALAVLGASLLVFRRRDLSH